MVLFISAVLISVVARTLAPGGWNGPKLFLLLTCALSAPWTGFCAANGLIGFVLRLRRPAVPPPLLVRGDPPRTAITLTIRNEDMELVLPPVRRLLDGLDAAFVGDSFSLFILSDTQDPHTAQLEEAAVAGFQAADRRPDRVHYRRRTENTGFKAGNIMDFLDHLAGDHEVMLVLDADSEMTAEAVMRLVIALRDDPSLGIIQHLTVGLPAASAFPRLFQFGMRAGMRTWATALSWWQDDECVYWGHNAAVRIAPFRDHCRLPLLPDGTPILSHDQVEAAILRGAGWGVRLLAEEDGSFEANPPALPEFMRRELRWVAGNFQYRHLFGLPGLRPMGRWQLLQAILLFGNTAFNLLFLLAAAWIAATNRTSGFPLIWALAATVTWVSALYAPKWLGYLEVLVSPAKAQMYGGPGRLLSGVLLETLYTLTLDAVTLWAKTAAAISSLAGIRTGWAPQNRAGRGVSWREAAGLLWPQTLLGAVVLTGFAQAGWTALLWALPFAGGMFVSIPFCVITADPRVGRWLRSAHLASIPEEQP
jgi:membrane glycosyltransferase